jgi:DNA-binding NarL/FixJ family response regulator
LLRTVLETASPEIAAALAAAHAELLFTRGDAAGAAQLIARTLPALTDAAFVYEALLKFARFGTARQARQACQLLQTGNPNGEAVRQVHSLLAEAIVLRNDGEVAAARTIASQARDRSALLGLRLLEALASEQLDDPTGARTLYESMGATRLARRLSATPERGGRARFTLTAREREVAELVAKGLSNRSIGERLSRSDRTVEHHIGSIFSKLGLRTRAELAGFIASSPQTL